MCASFLLACLALPASATVTYYGCVNNSTGAVTIVSSSTTCHTGFHKIQWNQTGPAGPTGPRGATGATGPQGPQGPPGLSEGTFELLHAVGSDTTLVSTPVVYLSTNEVLTASWYFISASLLLYVDASDGGAFCYDDLHSTGTASQFGGSSLTGGYQQVSITDAVFLNPGDYVEVKCYSDNGDGHSFIYNGAITSIRIDSFSSASSVPSATQQGRPKPPR